MITKDSYLIVRHIIKSILRTSSEVRNYFAFINKEIRKDMLFKKCLKKNPSEAFIKFIRKLKEIKLDYNIVISIANIERAYDPDIFDNFIYTLRSALPDLPPFLKFVFTIG
jgi:hypothetical protein